jgi:hypothetical protein
MARGYKKGTHQKDCPCPVCQSFRGERKKGAKVYTHFLVDKDVKEALKQIAHDYKVSVSEIVDYALWYTYGFDIDCRKFRKSVGGK